METAALQQRTDRYEVFEFGPFRLSPSQRVLVKDNKPLSLGSRALDILIALVERAGEVVSHKELIQSAWPDLVVEDANLRVHIVNLRKAIGDGYVSNVPGRGYCFLPSVRRIPIGTSSSSQAEPSRCPQLPPLQRVIGRDETVRSLHKLIKARRFVTIVGPGGVGKTTLAIAVAHEMALQFQGAVSFVDLGALRDDALVVSTVASAVGFAGEAQESLPSLLALLAKSRRLLVLDSCEHVIASVAALTEGMLRENPGVCIIATSREALRVQGEYVHLIQPLESPAAGSPLSAAEALTYPAVQLFIDRSIAAGHRQQLTDEDAPIVAEICRQLDGIPLALELVASKSASYGIRGLGQRIGDRVMLLWKGRRSIPRHETLAAMLDWSYDLLLDDERSALRSLSVFVGTFTLDMAQAVATGSDQEQFQVLDIVASLVDKSLISVSGSRQALSYRLLDTTRTHAAVKLREHGDERMILRRHASYFASMLASTRIESRAGAGLEVCARYIDDIRAALEWTFSEVGDRPLRSVLGPAAVPLFLAMSLLSECRRWSLQCLASLPEEMLGTAQEMKLQLALATSSHHAHNDTTEVLHALQRGLSLADSLDDAACQLEFLAGINVFGTRFADAGPPLSAAKRYASIAMKGRDAGEMVTAEWMLGSSYHLIGDQASALRSYEKGLSLARAKGTSGVRCFGYDHRARALVGYARTLWLSGHPDLAVRFAREGIEVAEQESQPSSFNVCLVLAFAAPMFLWRGDLDVAEGLIEQLVAHANRYSLKSYQAAGLGMRGELMMLRGEVQTAVEVLRTALPTLQSERRFFFVSACSRALAQALTLCGRSAEAAIVIDAVLDEAEGGGGYFEVPELMRTRSMVLVAASPDNWREAELALQASLHLARQQSAIGWELRSAMLLSREWWNRGRTMEARSLLADVFGRFSEGFDTSDLTKAARQLREFGG